MFIVVCIFVILFYTDSIVVDILVTYLCNCYIVDYKFVIVYYN
nr:MAG TPA: hypothetical protein [Caudoviricetes sp.]